MVTGAMVADTYNNQLIAAAEEMTEVVTAMAAAMATKGSHSDRANNKLKAAAKETAVAVMATATATATATLTVTAGGGGGGGSDTTSVVTASEVASCPILSLNCANLY